MLIAILSDIHGNVDALKSVLAEAVRKKVSKIIILGDCVGYYYNSKEVFDLIQEWDHVMVKGNHENYFLDVMDGKVDAQSIKAKYGSSIEIAIKELSEKIVNKIRALPETSDCIFDNSRVKICHGSPWNVDQYIYPDADVSLLERCNDSGFDYIFLGHTHYPFIHRGAFSIIANPGSVGQSRVHGGIADWAIFDSYRKSYIPKQTKYDTSRLKQLINEIDPDLTYLRSILER